MGGSTSQEGEGKEVKRKYYTSGGSHFLGLVGNSTSREETERAKRKRGGKGQHTLRTQ